MPVQEVWADGSVHTLAEKRLTQAYQIINVPDFCNECGNCRTFCPSSGAPYLDKPHVHLSRTSLHAHGEGFFLAADNTLESMAGGEKGVLTKEKGTFCFEDEDVQVTIDAGTLGARVVVLKRPIDRKSLWPAAEAGFLYRLLSGRQPFCSHVPAG